PYTTLFRSIIAAEGIEREAPAIGRDAHRAAGAKGQPFIQLVADGRRNLEAHQLGGLRLLAKVDQDQSRERRRQNGGEYQQRPRDSRERSGRRDLALASAENLINGDAGVA